MTATRSISVVVPCFNSAATLDACLTSVLASTHDNFEVIVVDDGSSDHTLDVARKYGCRVLALPANRGAAAARNAGAKVAVGDILFFLDADIRVTPGVLKQIDATFTAMSDISATFCSYEKQTVPTNFCSVYKNLLHHYTHQTAREDAITFCSGFGAVLSDVFLRTGGFGESYRYLEDIEYGYRLHLAGHKIHLNKHIQLTHLKQYSFWGLIRSDVWGRAVPWTRIMLEKCIYRNDLNTKITNVLSVALACLLLPAVAAATVSLLSWSLPPAMIASLLVLNWRFYRFLQREKGWVFALRGVAMSWLGYVYSAIGLGLGLLSFVAAKCSPKATPQTAAKTDSEPPSHWITGAVRKSQSAFPIET